MIPHKKYQDAQSILRKLIATDPGNAALDFAAGYVYQQQENWDEALDSYQNSLALMPGLSDTPAACNLFYRDDDGDNAIAEARTPLSIDPGNAEAYRFLGLGLYANNQCAAAVHAFQSLARQPERGRLLRHGNHAPRLGRGRCRRGRKAIALNPRFWEAHNNLGMLLHDLIARASRNYSGS